MEEARAVLARLERIEALERRGAAPGPLLQELRKLAREAAAWAERERDPRARGAAAALAGAIEAGLTRDSRSAATVVARIRARPSDSAPHSVRR